VLSNTEGLVFRINQLTMSNLCIPYFEDDFIEHTFNTDLGSSGWLQKNGYDQQTIKKFRSARNNLLFEAFKKSHPIKTSTLDFLSDIREDFRTCLVTNSYNKTFIQLPGSNELARSFDAIAFREDYRQAKPAPDAYLSALEKMRLSPHQVIVVEDSPRGIEAAKNASLKVVAIRNPEFPSLNLSKANFQIGRLEQLRNLVSKIQ